MSTIKFRLAAKTDVGLVRTNNEDNFQMTTDLSSDQMRWVNNEICSLGDKGALLVVADGMGGMNAGEVASALAVETVREYFASEKLTPEVTKNRFTIEKYMNEVIVAADTRIKKEAKEHPETRGMGTTVVIGWILNGKLYVSWCGDSRAYIYNPEAGLHQITKDHSYVQTLVDKGSISKEDAFDYPDSNIITRSLSDGGSKAKPDSLLKPYDLCDHDIILLCTDGLNGMIRDNEIEAVIRENEHDMNVLVDQLIHAACEAEGSDNITLCLCQILQGGGVCDPSVFEESEVRRKGGQERTTNIIVGQREDENRLGKKILIGLGVCLAIAAIVLGIWYFIPYHEKKDEPKQEVNMEEPKTENEQNTEQSTIETEASTNNNPNANGEKTDQTSEIGGADRTGINSSNGGKLLKNIESSNSDTAVDAGGKQKQREDVSNENSESDAPDPGALNPNGNIYNKDSVITYRVEKNDTYYSIAESYKVNCDSLQKWNNNKELQSGDTIRILINKNK